MSAHRRYSWPEMSFPGQTEGHDTPPTSRLENNNKKKHMEALFSFSLFMFFHSFVNFEKLSVVKNNCAIAKFFCHETNRAIVLVM